MVQLGAEMRVLGRWSVATIFRGAKRSITSAVQQLLVAAGAPGIAALGASQAVVGVDSLSLPPDRKISLFTSRLKPPTMEEQQQVQGARRIDITLVDDDGKGTTLAAVRLYPTLALCDDLPARAAIVMISTGTGIGCFAVASTMEPFDLHTGASGQTTQVAQGTGRFSDYDYPVKVESDMLDGEVELELLWEIPFLWIAWHARDIDPAKTPTPAEAFYSWAMRTLEREMEPALFALHFREGATLPIPTAAAPSGNGVLVTDAWASFASHARWALNRYSPGCRSHMQPILAAPRIRTPEATTESAPNLLNGGSFPVRLTMQSNRRLLLIQLPGVIAALKISSSVFDFLPPLPLTTEFAGAVIKMRYNINTGFVDFKVPVALDDDYDYDYGHEEENDEGIEPFASLAPSFLLHLCKHGFPQALTWFEREFARILPAELDPMSKVKPGLDSSNDPYKWKKLKQSSEKDLLDAGRPLVKADAGDIDLVSPRIFHEDVDGYLSSGDEDSYTVGIVSTAD